MHLYCTVGMHLYCTVGMHLYCTVGMHLYCTVGMHLYMPHCALPGTVVKPLAAELKHHSAIRAK